MSDCALDHHRPHTVSSHASRQGSPHPAATSFARSRPALRGTPRPARNLVPTWASVVILTTSGPNETALKPSRTARGLTQCSLGAALPITANTTERSSSPHSSTGSTTTTETWFDSPAQPAWITRITTHGGCPRWVSGRCYGIPRLVRLGSLKSGARSMPDRSCSRAVSRGGSYGSRLQLGAFGRRRPFRGHADVSV